MDTLIDRNILISLVSTSLCSFPFGRRRTEKVAAQNMRWCAIRKDPMVGKHHSPPFNHACTIRITPKE